MTDIDLNKALALADKVVDAIKSTYDQDHARRRAEAMRTQYPDMDPKLFDLMVRASRAEDSLFLLRLDLYHLANRNPESVPTALVRELLSAHHFGDTVPTASDHGGGGSDD